MRPNPVVPDSGIVYNLRKTKLQILESRRKCVRQQALCPLFHECSKMNLQCKLGAEAVQLRKPSGLVCVRLLPPLPEQAAWWLRQREFVER